MVSNLERPMIAAMRYPFAEDVRRVVDSLVAGDHAGLEGNRMSAADLAGAIAAYGRQLITPPEAAFETIDAVRVHDGGIERWSVRFDLWTAEEGRSDLTLEMTVKRAGSGYSVDVDDLHVL